MTDTPALTIIGFVDGAMLADAGQKRLRIQLRLSRKPTRWETDAARELGNDFRLSPSLDLVEFTAGTQEDIAPTVDRVRVYLKSVNARAEQLAVDEDREAAQRKRERETAEDKARQALIDAGLDPLAPRGGMGETARGSRIW